MNPVSFVCLQLLLAGAVAGTMHLSGFGLLASLLCAWFAGGFGLPLALLALAQLHDSWLNG